LAGCAGLYFLGFKQEALSVYLLSRVAEVSLVIAHLLSLRALLWVTDLLPAIVCADLLISKILSASEEPNPTTT